MLGGAGGAHYAGSTPALGRGVGKGSKHRSVTGLGRAREIGVHAPGDAERGAGCLREAAQESRNGGLRTEK